MEHADLPGVDDPSRENKILPSLEDAIRAAGLKDGMTISPWLRKTTGQSMKNPKELLIAQTATQVIDAAGYFYDGFSMFRPISASFSTTWFTTWSPPRKWWWKEMVMPSTDAEYADKVVVLTNHLVRYPNAPWAIPEDNVDYIVVRSSARPGRGQ